MKFEGPFDLKLMDRLYEARELKMKAIIAGDFNLNDHLGYIAAIRAFDDVVRWAAEIRREIHGKRDDDDGDGD